MFRGVQGFIGSAEGQWPLRACLGAGGRGHVCAVDVDRGDGIDKALTDTAELIADRCTPCGDDRAMELVEQAGVQIGFELSDQSVCVVVRCLAVEAPGGGEPPAGLEVGC